MSRYELLQGLLCGSFIVDGKIRHTRTKRDDLSLFSATVLFNLFSTGVSWTKQWHTLRYSFSLWVQPTNTNVKIIPLQIGLKYIHTQSLSLSQAPGTKIQCFTHTHMCTHTHFTAHIHSYNLSLKHTQPFTIEYILRKTKQSIILFFS